MAPSAQLTDLATHVSRALGDGWQVETDEHDPRAVVLALHHISDETAPAGPIRIRFAPTGDRVTVRLLMDLTRRELANAGTTPEITVGMALSCTKPEHLLRHLRDRFLPQATKTRIHLAADRTEHARQENRQQSTAQRMNASAPGTRRSERQANNPRHGSDITLKWRKSFDTLTVATAEIPPSGNTVHIHVPHLTPDQAVRLWQELPRIIG